MKEEKYYNPIIVLDPKSKKEKPEGPYQDWMFMNYTFKRFEGLTMRGAIPLMTQDTNANFGAKKNSDFMTRFTNTFNIRQRQREWF